MLHTGSAGRIALQFERCRQSTTPNREPTPLHVAPRQARTAHALGTSKLRLEFQSHHSCPVSWVIPCRRQALLPLLPQLPGEQLLCALRGLSTATRPLHPRHVAQLDAAVAARLRPGAAAGHSMHSSSSNSADVARAVSLPMAATRAVEATRAGYGEGLESVDGQREQQEQQREGAVERGSGNGDGGGGKGPGTGASRAPVGALLRGVQMCEALVCVARMAARHRYSTAEPVGREAAEAVEVATAAAEGAGGEGAGVVAGTAGGGESSVQSPSGGGPQLGAKRAAAFQVGCLWR